jgi:Domain of unknown function DUF11
MAADLSITKTDGNTSVVPGTSDTYTITVSNNGPDTVSSGGGSVSGDTSGIGALATTVDLPANASVTFSFTVQISPLATGTYINTATVSPPAGVTDNDPGNNSATDSDTLTPQADLSITKTDGVTSVVPGTVDTYTITVTNNGPKWVAGGS